MQSLLARTRQNQIVDDPFPHLVVHEALEPDYYRQLAADFPADEIILDGRTPVSNSNFRYAASAILDDARISAVWREFVRYHVSPEFFNEVRALFESCIRELHPRLESSVAKPLSDWQSSIRFREPIRHIALECQFTYGAPVDVRSRVIGPHVDREVALYAGLFYMRQDNDDSGRRRPRVVPRFKSAGTCRRLTREVGWFPTSTRHALQDDTLCQQHACLFCPFAPRAARGFTALADQVSAAPHKFCRRTGHEGFRSERHGLARHITLIRTENRNRVLDSIVPPDNRDDLCHTTGQTTSADSDRRASKIGDIAALAFAGGSYIGGREPV